MGPVLKIDADCTGVDDLGDTFRHIGWRATITLLYIGGERYMHDARYACGRRDHFGPRRCLAIGKAERPIDAPARRSDGVETCFLDDPCGQCVPGVGKQEQGAGSVACPEVLGKSLLSDSVHWLASRLNDTR